VKLNVTAGNENRQVKIAASLLASSLDDARNRAIAGNTYAQIAIDVSSDHKFRRIAMMKQFQGDWMAEREILLPERTFVMPLNALAERLDNKDLAPYKYFEADVILQGATVSSYTFTFNPEGHLCDSNSASTILGVGYGAKIGDGIIFKKDINIYGIFITLAGQNVILESKDAIEEAI
jgi:hypothetical protein